MASLSHSESRRLYSWWWDSHISPKNSKWLQENLTDMDAKVKAMIKLIEEDADSFARRAEMYYKKRPELMKLVEEFYRAYRALAERYDHATGELRQAHRTMADAFPNQVPFVLADDSPSGSAHGSEPHTPEKPRVRAFVDPDDLHNDALVISSSGLSSVNKNGSCRMKEKEESLCDEVSQLSNENLNLRTKVLSESQRAGKAESEVGNLKKALTDMQAEKEAVLSQYQQSLEKLSSLEGELICTEKDSTRLKEQASKAESDYFTLKEAIFKLEAERDAYSVKNKDCLEKISNLEVMVSCAHADVKGLDERSFKAEIEVQYLKNELSRIESERETGLIMYKQCLEKISDLEKKVYIREENARRLSQQAERAGTEVEKLKVALAEINAQKEATSLEYKLCLEKISKLESEISSAQEDSKRLNCEILMGSTKLRKAEDKCGLLEISNQNLQLEADNLVKKIALKDKELSEKHGELDKLQVCVQDERSRYNQVEATLRTLQNMHSQSQEEQRTLALELKNGLQMLKDLEICKHGLEDEIRQIKDENRSLNEINSSSTLSIRDLQNGILGLTKLKEKLEDEVGLQLGRSSTLQEEVCSLKEEINGLNLSYHELIKQVEFVGLNPKSFGSSVKGLQAENSRLRQICEKDRDEKEMLFKKLEYMDEIQEKNANLCSSLSELNSELQMSEEKAKVLQESCHILHGEKSSLVSEKSVLLSQLQIINENMQKLLEKNTVLENSLCGANVELGGLREKSKSLEELCQLLGNEKANLLSERSALAEQLEIVERRLNNLEKRFTEFEEKYTGLEKEKESTHSKLEELRVSFGVEKQERSSSTQWSESRLTSLENHIHILEEESCSSKKEFQEELENAVISKFEVFILQKFVEDMEDKNYTLLMECQKHVEASKVAEELISELEKENLEQQVEEELLLVEIEKLRLGIYQIFKTLGVGPDIGAEEKVENEQIFVHDILEDIANMKHSISNYSDDKQKLVVENSVLLTLFGQLRLEGLEVESEKYNLGQALKTLTEQLLMVQREKRDLFDTNRQLRAELSMGNHQANVLMAEVESLSVKQDSMQSSYLELQDQYSQILEEHRALLKRFADLKTEKSILEEENNALLMEMLTFGNLSTIFESLKTEIAVEMEQLSEDLHKFHEVNIELENEVSTLREKLGKNESENLHMRNLVEKVEMELSGVKDLNYRLNQEIASREDLLSLREKEILEAEQKLIVTESLNSDLCRTVEEQKNNAEKSELIRENLEVRLLGLSEDTVNQSKEIQCLLEVKGNLESEVGILNEEIEVRRIREENLYSELQERHNEFELWDAEASTFYFDLQFSAIREVLFEDKVHELTGACKKLYDECASKSQEIEEMEQRVSFRANEIDELKAQLLAYAPAIDSLRDKVESLERGTLSRAKFVVADSQTPKGVEVDVHTHEETCQELVDDPNLDLPDDILDFQKLQNRIKAVENVVVKERNRLAKQERSSSNVKLDAAMKEIAKLKSKCRLLQGKGKEKEDQDNLKSQKIKPDFLEVKNGILMKDIPLDQVSDHSLYGRSRRGNSRADDQMLVLWETADDNRKQAYEPIEDDIVYNQFELKNENPSSELEMDKEMGVVNKLQVSRSTSMRRRGSRKKILERLNSDCQKLANIQITVQDLRRKLGTDKKSGKAKNVDLETVKEQLQEVEETATQLSDLNGQMTRKVEEILVSYDGQGSLELEEGISVQKRKVSEEARKGSEKIGRLQLEIQKIQYMLLKMEDERKSKGKNRLSRTKGKTIIILRDFIHSGKGSSGRKEKGRLCGCFKPSTSGEGNL